MHMFSLNYNLKSENVAKSFIIRGCGIQDLTYKHLYDI
jgi:hypothetical protein